MPMIPEFLLVPGPVSLAATYEPRLRQLKVFAEGSADTVEYGFKFSKHDDWVGGLAYDLKAWVGPALPPPSTPWKYQQKFTVLNSPRFPAPKSIRIFTGQYPEGKQVEVRWLGIEADFDGTKPDSPDFPNPIERRVIFFGETVTVSPKANPSGVRPSFDDHFLGLKGANILHGNLNLTFRPLRTGTTRVQVHFGEVSIPEGDIYEIIVLGPGPGPVRPPNGDAATQALTTETSLSSADASAILNFRGGLLKAQNIVLEQYPSAKLYTVECDRQWVSTEPAHTAWELSQLNVTFRVDNGHVEIRSIGGWYHWDTPIYSQEVLIGLSDVPFPELGLEGAVSLLNQSDAPGVGFWDAELVYPQWSPSPGEIQPYYKFRMADDSVWAVGVNDGKVYNWSTPNEKASAPTEARNGTVSASAAPAAPVPEAASAPQSAPAVSAAPFTPAIPVAQSAIAPQPPLVGVAA